MYHNKQFCHLEPMSEFSAKQNICEFKNSHQHLNIQNFASGASRDITGSVSGLPHNNMMCPEPGSFTTGDYSHGPLEFLFVCGLLHAVVGWDLRRIWFYTHCSHLVSDEGVFLHTSSHFALLCLRFTLWAVSRVAFRLWSWSPHVLP